MNSIFVQPIFSNERAVFYRERAAGMYSVAPWYLGIVSGQLDDCCVYISACPETSAG